LGRAKLKCEQDKTKKEIVMSSGYLDAEEQLAAVKAKQSISHVNVSHKIKYSTQSSIPALLSLLLFVISNHDLRKNSNTIIGIVNMSVFSLHLQYLQVLYMVQDTILHKLIHSFYWWKIYHAV